MAPITPIAAVYRVCNRHVAPLSSPTIFIQTVLRQTIFGRPITIGRIKPTNASSISELQSGNQSRSNVDGSSWSQLTTKQKVVQSGQNIGYGGVIVFGVGILGYAIWTTVSDLSKTSQAWKIYDASVEHVLDSVQVQQALGIPITPQPGPGPASSRGSKTLRYGESVSSETHERLLNLKYYVYGLRQSGVVDVQAVWDPQHKYQTEQNEALSFANGFGLNLFGLSSPWSLQVIVVNASGRRIVVMDRRLHSNGGSSTNRGWMFSLFPRRIIAQSQTQRSI
ncbi:hypothetical protein BATDEDRAFT_25138 [Batrachochytrium dendrobatidis JAM81]|uniref:Mitochondrial import inner membrane translocase subunit Tim21 n=2 Tax=Batrachochytrium dendrobatidis TaxID=109871 RepID=F4P2Q6_BATDJ|nr:uncharacterized protein BATDEDRAFT_25138 [Batrachochytrium dendrobatidis JAM81]EGF80504.1 hypothetical protein BATDEDRAFT_25138 [Batrachochytrium dendrobatidis JAM81]KAK5670081.1 Mitochondrial import inner membrane translocase subunit Tim21 [Batrachochytrium dendrobatidis]KAK5670091.1 Mitochondrial import inner membrane translocase subunit Tim21 [Batrachochytrium dendrobatidis]OAJ40929.1 hypothetical protein BDEG_24611 [Batrachochytrium dendrobatidis JEL423]|eukprot:XP_006679032.1 hypothetical protein BATDEDRAFT_25138 [Batrachochytrium dendrobatidis JAM81]